MLSLSPKFDIHIKQEQRCSFLVDFSGKIRTIKESNSAFNLRKEID